MSVEDEGNEQGEEKDTEDSDSVQAELSEGESGEAGEESEESKMNGSWEGAGMRRFRRVRGIGQVWRRGRGQVRATKSKYSALHH